MCPFFYVLGVVPDSFCFDKRIRNNNVEKGWLIFSGDYYGTTDVLVTASWNDVWLNIYHIPYNASGYGSNGSFYKDTRWGAWSIVENHFRDGLSIYVKGTTGLCFKIGKLSKMLIEFTALYSHHAGNITVETQQNFDVSGWTQLYPTT